MKIIFAVLVSLVGVGNDIPADTEALLSRLLSRIDSSSYYIANKEAELKKQSEAIQEDVSVSLEQYQKYYDLGCSFFKFSSDSSIYYFKRAEHVALQLNRPELSCQARLKSVQILTAIGFFKEAGDMIAGIKKSDLPPDMLPLYYSSYSAVYHESYLNNASLPEMHRKYVRKYSDYQDSLFAVADRTTDEYLRLLEKRCARNGDFSGAEEINSRRMNALPRDSSLLALVVFDRFTLITNYMRKPIDDGIDCLLQSAMIDVINANQESGSSKYIIAYLLDHGRINEARRISEYYYQTMLRYGSRIRRANAFEPEMQINRAYMETASRQTRRIAVSLIFITLLAIVLLVLSIRMYRSRHKIISLNDDLERSNIVSKSYVVEFFRLYSEYVDRILKFRAEINTGLRRGETGRIIEMTNPDKETFDEELKMMYKRFDSSFLGIFPDYVDNFNSMLKPEFQVFLKPGELNTELRVFALVKMGVSDSGQISELLHYSVKTVYNKRSEIKTKIQVPLDEFYSRL